VHVGTFAGVANADTAKKVIQAQGYPVIEQTIQEDGRDLWVVMAGPFADRAAALKASRKLGGLVTRAAPKR
jgi:cell division septation protein DedD